MYNYEPQESQVVCVSYSFTQTYILQQNLSESTTGLEFPFSLIVLLLVDVVVLLILVLIVLLLLALKPANVIKASFPFLVTHIENLLQRLPYDPTSPEKLTTHSLPATIFGACHFPTASGSHHIPDAPQVLSSSARQCLS